MKKIVLASLLSVTLITASHASARDITQGLCHGKFPFAETNADYSDFDFWLGEWLVVDTETKQLRAYDKVTRELDGCVIKQDITTFDDQYSIKETGWRLNGMSFSGIKSGGEWRQAWLDNAGNNFALVGSKHEDGTMVFTSEKLTWTVGGKTSSVQYRWYWKAGKDGTVRNWGHWLDKNGNDSKKLFDVTYIQNTKGTHVFEPKQ